MAYNDDVYRPRRHGQDDDYETEFWRTRDERDRPRGDDFYDYSSLPVLGTNYGGGRRNDPQRDPWTRESGRDWREERGRSGESYGERNEPYGRGYSGRYAAGGYAGSQYGAREGFGREGYGTRYYGRERERDWQRESPGERGWWDRTKDEVRSWMGDTDAERRRQQDYRGRGPKGYTRSDERIREDVNDRLMADSYVDATEIEVSVSSGEVTLSGSVEDRNSKRRAEDIAAEVLGVRDVTNSLRVRSSRYGSELTSGVTTTTTADTTTTQSTPRH